MAKAKTQTLELEFSKDKETKNTIRFQEDVEEDATPVVGMVYLKKQAVKDLGDPENLLLTIAPADE
jgi:hypothetical protein